MISSVQILETNRVQRKRQTDDFLLCVTCLEDIQVGVLQESLEYGPDIGKGGTQEYSCVSDGGA